MDGEYPAATVAYIKTRRACCQARLVVDHFHLVKLANDALTAVRRRITWELRNRRGQSLPLVRDPPRRRPSVTRRRGAGVCGRSGASRGSRRPSVRRRLKVGVGVLCARCYSAFAPSSPNTRVGAEQLDGVSAIADSVRIEHLRVREARRAELPTAVDRPRRMTRAAPGNPSRA